MNEALTGCRTRFVIRGSRIRCVGCIAARVLSPKFGRRANLRSDRAVMQSYLNAVRYCLQISSADIMAEAVVDALELVDVDIERANCSPPAARFSSRSIFAGTAPGFRPVRSRVVMREVGISRRLRPALGTTSSTTLMDIARQACGSREFPIALK